MAIQSKTGTLSSHADLQAAKTDALEVLDKLQPAAQVLLGLAGVAAGLRILARELGYSSKSQSYLFMTNKYWRRRFH